MARRNLPIYARMRAKQTSSAVSLGYAPVPVKPSLDKPSSKTPNYGDFPHALAQPYPLETLAGRADTVWHRNPAFSRKEREVSVWRSGYRDGKAQQALFNKPAGLALDRRGNLYLADSLNHAIRRISPQGKVSTLLGNGQRGHLDGPAYKARLNHPTALALSTSGELYILDQGNRCLRRLNLNGNLQTLSVPGLPLGGLALAEQMLYLIIEIRSAQGKQAALCQINLQSGVSALLSQWEGHWQWIPYRNDDESQPFSRWWQGRSTYPLPFQICELKQAEGLGLAINPSGHLQWLNGLRLMRLQAANQTPNHWQLQEQNLNLSAWPAPHWQGLSFDRQGQLLALDSAQHVLYQINAEGYCQALSAISAPDFLRPQAVIADAYGRIYVSDSGHWRVCRLIPHAQKSLLHLAKMAFLPYLPEFTRPVIQYPDLAEPLAVATTPPAKGVFKVVQRFLKRKDSDALYPAEAVSSPALAQQHLQDVLQQGNRSQQLVGIKELMAHLQQPLGSALLPLRPLLKQALAHPDAAIRTLFIRHLCDTVHQEADALFWLELLEQNQEPNRLLQKYLLEVLAYLGRRFSLYGHVVPLMLTYLTSPEEDIADTVFEHLHRIREAGYESLVDPLLEEISRL